MASAISCSASSASSVNGFSTYTWQPRSRHNLAMSKWLAGGVVTCTTSGRASRRSSATSLKYRVTGNLSQNCLAISGSRSQAATISHPSILRI
jgi:hypothetical protein